MNTSRRGFLGGALGASVAFAETPAFAADSTGSDNGDLKLGVASYSFREFSRHLAVTWTKKLGVSYINFKDVHLALNATPQEIARAKKDLATAGLTLVGGGNISFDKDDEADIRSKFEYAKAAGMPLIVCAPTAVTLPKLEKYVKEYNIKIAVHPHGPEDKNFPTPDSAMVILKNMDPRCGICLDIGHATRAGVDLIACIRELGPRLLDMHTKDLANKTERDSQVAVGDGILPIPGIFRELKKMNYPGYVNLEYEINSDDPMPGMTKSFAYMRGVLAGMKA